MKLKAAPLALAALALLMAFIVYAVVRTSGAGSPTLTAVPPVEGVAVDKNSTDAARVKKDEAFLAQVRESEQKVDITQGVGSQLPDTAKGVSSPKISVEHTEVDLGIVPNDHVSSHPFKIANTGSLPLEIHAVATSCPCTKGIIPAGGLSIPPGGEANMDIQIDPSHIADFYATRYLTIASNDPVSPALKLTVTSHVNPEYETDPREVDFGVLDKGTPLEQKVRLRQLTNEKLDIVDVNADGGREEFKGIYPELGLSYALVPEAEWKAPGKAEYDVTIKLSGDAASGKLVFRTFIKSTIKRLPYYPLMVRAMVESPYKMSPLNPESLALAANTNKPATLTLSGESPISVANVAVDAEKFIATVRPGENPNVVYIDANMAPNPPTGELNVPLTFDVIYGGKTYRDKIYVRAMVPKVGMPAGAGEK